MPAPSEVELKALNESLPYMLAKQVGSSALANTLTDLLDAMSPAARVTALNSLAALVTALETVVDSSRQPGMHVVLDLTKDAKHDTEPNKVFADAPLVAPTLEEAHSQLPTTIVVEEISGEGFSGKSLRFLYDYADSSNVDRLMLEHAELLANNFAQIYIQQCPKTKRTNNEIAYALSGYFSGLTDDEIADSLGETSGAVQVFRSKIFKTIKDKLGDKGVDEIFARVVDAEIIVANNVVDSENNEQHITSPASTDKIQRILGEYGIADVEEVESKSHIEQMYELAETLWDKNQLASLRSLVEEQASEVGPDVSREVLLGLMDKFAPRWFRKLGIEKQATWEAAANILGYKRQSISVSDYDRKHRGPFGIQGVTARDLFVEMTLFLLEKEASNAPVVPAQRHAQTKVR